MDPAPFHNDVAGAPDTTRALWVHTADGTRLRIAIEDGGTRGTAVVLTGRTEYAEKYGAVVGRLAASGFSVVVIDWRGQGLSDRAFANRLIGHVGDFDEFQTDLAAVLAHPAVAALPGPRWWLCHSMGGCIGLTALARGARPAAAVFSAPMWGLPFPWPVPPLIRGAAWLASAVGRPHTRMPGGGSQPYALSEPFDDNVLTSDHATWEAFGDQLRCYPDLAIAGPSLAWLAGAFRAMGALDPAHLPDLATDQASGLPVKVFVGTDEKVVSPARIRQLSQHLAGQPPVVLEGARHEPLMETPAIRTRLWDEVDGFLQGVPGL